MVMNTNSFTKNSNIVNSASADAAVLPDRKTCINNREVACLGVMVALLEVSKIALAIIPNVELVSLLLIVFTCAVGRKAYLVTIGYAMIECLLWGMGTWVIMYLYVWPILVATVRLMQKMHIESVLAYSIASGAFGLLFGAFSSITYVVIGGWSMGVSWWINGIPFDLIHGASNFIICLVLFKSVRKIAYKVIL